MVQVRAKIDLFILYFLHLVGSKERKEDINVIPCHCCTNACSKGFNNLLRLWTISPSRTSLNSLGWQVRERPNQKLRAWCRCTMTHSNSSMWALPQKWSVAKVHPKLTFPPISPSYTLYNFSQEHRITSTHMEKVEYFLGSRNQRSMCFNLKSPLATRRFTEYTSQSLLEQSGSHGYHVIFWWKRNRKNGCWKLTA